MGSQLEYALKCDDVGPNGVTGERTLGDGDCRVLAERFELLDVTSASYNFSVLRKKNPQGYHLTGKVSGNVVQACARTSEPIQTAVSEQFDVFCCTATQLSEQDSLDELVDWDEKDVESIDGDFIQIGEIVAQYFGLAINPYLTGTDSESDVRHSSGIEVLTEDEAKRRASPFSVLKNLSDKA